MQCRLCGYEFDEDAVGKSCQGCGKKECEKVHCPNCGFGNTVEFENDFKILETLKNKLGFNKNKK